MYLQRCHDFWVLSTGFGDVKQKSSGCISYQVQWQGHHHTYYRFILHSLTMVCSMMFLLCVSLNKTKSSKNTWSTSPSIQLTAESVSKAVI